MNQTFNLEKLIIRNFLSFGNNYTEIDLSVPGSTLINGENIDTNSANGAGKCVCGDTLINIRNKETGEIVSISIRELYEKVSQQRREDIKSI